MAIEQTLGFSSTVFRKKFRSAMTVRSFRDNEIIFSKVTKPMQFSISRAVRLSSRWPLRVAKER
jgi:hypothetical protein